MSHLLAIGATGMLGGVVRAVAPGFEDITLVARHASEFALHDDAQSIHHVDADWTDTQDFDARLMEALDWRPPVTRCLLWGHDAGRDALERTIRDLKAPCDVLHVLGSSSGDPRPEAERWRAVCREGVGYISVALGRMAGGSSYRWLTHDEICDGVLRAWRSGEDTVVGKIV